MIEARPDALSCPAAADAAAIVARLTFDEKAALLAGSDLWHFGGIPRLGIPPLRVADCGHGVTLVEEGARGVTCLPTAIGMGATWDAKLMERAGALLGRECRALGVGILLGPMVNLQRLPVGGRNFETFSEDPHLTASLATALVRGIQSTGTGACVKHIAGYAQTRHSRTHSVEIDLRTLRELYLRHFADIIRQARPAAVMTAYNKINGLDSAAHPGLLKDFLRDELGYAGVVLSDWGGVHGPEVIAAGLDLEMPGPPKHVTPANISDAIARGELTDLELESRATRVLQANLAHAINARQPSELDSPAHRQLAREIAEASIVLLKNDDAILPLNVTAAGPIRRIAIIGPNATTARLGGSGSASVTPSRAISPLEGLRSRLVGTGVDILHAEGCPAHGSGPVATGNYSVRFYNNTDLSGGPACVSTTDRLDYNWGWAAPAAGVRRWRFSASIEGSLDLSHSPPEKLRLLYEAGGARVWINGQLVHDNWSPDDTGTFEDRYGAHAIPITLPEAGSGHKTSLRIDFRQLVSGSSLRLEWMADDAHILRDEAVMLARSADAVIICAGLCNRFEGGGGDRSAFTLPEGQDELISAITAVNARTIVVLNGATAMSMPWLDQVPAILHAFYPGEEGGSALARVLCGDISPSGRLPMTFPRCIEDVPAMAFYPGTTERVCFGEGLFVGYRHFVTHPEASTPLFPFGYGLTYSTFKYSELELKPKRGEDGIEAEVVITLTNTGSRAAAEVVQLYVGQSNPSAPRPALELRAYRKLMLTPGESQRVYFYLKSDDLAWYDPTRHDWMIESGDYQVRVGPDSTQGLTGVFHYEPRLK